MTDFIAITRKAIATAVATGERFYTAEGMANAALSFVSVEDAKLFADKFGAEYLAKALFRSAQRMQ